MHITGMFRATSVNLAGPEKNTIKLKMPGCSGYFSGYTAIRETILNYGRIAAEKNGWFHA